MPQILNRILYLENVLNTCLRATTYKVMNAVRLPSIQYMERGFNYFITLYIWRLVREERVVEYLNMLEPVVMWKHFLRDFLQMLKPTLRIFRIYTVILYNIYPSLKVNYVVNEIAQNYTSDKEHVLYTLTVDLLRWKLLLYSWLDT